MIYLKPATAVEFYKLLIPTSIQLRMSKAKASYLLWDIFIYQWIGLRENLQESTIFNGKIYGFL
jgi:hypothetical protein